MATEAIADERIKRLNDHETVDGQYVLYWMQQSQRAECNHALEYAIQRANACGKRLLVCFGLTDSYPDANLRHYNFMLQGLVETEQALRERGIRFVVRIGDPAEVAVELSRDAAEVVCDRGYLRHQRQWRRTVAQNAHCPVWQVEADTIVPVETASDKVEYAARTIRPKLNKLRDRFTHVVTPTSLEKDSRDLSVRGADLSNIGALLNDMSVDGNVGPLEDFKGGTAEAQKRLKSFISNSLSAYDDRTDILQAQVSRLSPYLHFGQISPLQVAAEIASSRGHRKESKESFLEELLVRRELAINCVQFHREYDSLRCLPDWAIKTLDEHESDERPYHYTASELEQAETHDSAWNAAMIQMRAEGYLHNHMRMYWGKKIIEWTNTIQHAYRVTLELNNRYFLDGRDPNSYANVAWLFGLHDRAHQEREVFGKVRYMSEGGLRRKFDVDEYVRHVADKHQIEIKGCSD
jgi:deoxyribodipyrimidine photo-lyase